MKTIERIHPGFAPLAGCDDETKARAILQEFWLELMTARYENVDGNPARLLYHWLVKLGADDEALRRCGFTLLNDDGLRDFDRVASGPGAGADLWLSRWFDHARILRRKKDARLCVLTEPYGLCEKGLLQLAEMARIGLNVWIDGASGWNPGLTVQIMISEEANR